MAPKLHCRKRNELVESLVDVSIKLSIAASQMADLAAIRDTAGFDRAKTEVQRLRDECERIKRELDHHRAQHGC
ncbi:MAG: hypothetical protein JOY62_11210 [Acidobacteriaceae bacterium]|nr:hypothetical protein [Acidobacteriaceae bacterium]MBV9780527.1 hypothetical protein [Acidobacteriaceae bacterium]